MRDAVRLCSGILMLSLATGAAGAQTGEKTAPPPAARVAILGFAANVGSFRSVKCRYEITYAKAETFEDAKQGKWSNPLTVKYHWCLRDDFELIECDPPRQPPQDQSVFDKAKGPLVAGAGRIFRDRYLSDGDREIGHAPELSSVNLFNSSTPSVPPWHTPLAFGLMGHRKNSSGPEKLVSQPDVWVTWPSWMYVGR